MSAKHGPAALEALVKQSGINFYSRRVLQRWQRGEISTDIAVELLQADEAGRLIGTWASTHAPE
jgi:phosphoribosyl-AMP cyclohydrolase